MNRVFASAVFVVSTLLSFTPTNAQDGWVLSAKPPIVVRRDVETVNYYFTNTSDKTLHGIKINSVKDGKAQSVVIIDTVEPHKTAAVGFARIHESSSGSLREATITCTNYSSPIKLIP